MNYFALFLNEDSFIEKCISLMRFISDPSTRSAPHITVRLFKTSDSRIEESKQRKFSYLNIIEPGTFNLEKKKPPYVVYLRCESEELEDIEYKPDFPYSRLHITIYEGKDLKYAQQLYRLLTSFPWHFKLEFDHARKLIAQRVGIKNYKRPDFEAYFQEILEDDYLDFIDNCERDTSIKLHMMERLLHKLDAYLETEKPERIDSVYESRSRTNSAGGMEQEYRQRRLQFAPSDLEEDEAVTLEKPVTDAIYITPPEYARDMAKCGLEALGTKGGEIDFGDSAIGTGTLFLALKLWIDEVNRKQGCTYRLRSAIGVDIDREMADEAYMRCYKRGLKVIHGDALLPTAALGAKRNLMLVNPPFNRHEEIPGDYKKLICDLAREQTGISISGNAGLHAYHLLIMDKWLCEDAVAVWLLPTIFMQAKYGEAIRNYLLNNVQLIRLHVYNESVEQFDNIQVSTSIVVFRKRKSTGAEQALISYGDSLERPVNSRRIERAAFFEHIDNWRILLNEKASACADKKMTFDDFFEIKRGVATGANSFFVMTREKAKQYQIPDIALKPLIPKVRNLKSLVIEKNEDGYPDVEPQQVLIDCDLEEDRIRELYPAFYDYLQSAKVKDEDGNAIVDRFLVRKRRPWYKQERREPPAFLLTYMGRNKKNLPPLYFIRNKSQAIALNTYILLYPRDWLQDKLDADPALYGTVLEALNRSAEEIVALRTRVYSGGLNKIEPNELRKMPVIGLDKIVAKD